MNGLSSSQRNVPFVHPYTAFLVNQGLNNIFQSIQENQFGKALNQIYWFIDFLEPEIKQELTDDLATIEAMRTNTNSFTKPKFKKILNSVMSKLHSKGYFVAAKWKITPFNPTPKHIGTKEQ